MREGNRTGGDICLARFNVLPFGQLATAEWEVHHLSPRVTWRSPGMSLNKRPVQEGQQERL